MYLSSSVRWGSNKNDFLLLRIWQKQQHQQQQLLFFLLIVMKREEKGENSINNKLPLTPYFTDIKCFLCYFLGCIRESNDGNSDRRLDDHLKLGVFKRRAKKREKVKMM